MALNNPGFIDYNQLDEDVFLVTYKNKVSYNLLHQGGKQPANSAVQISAAISAYGRIILYPFIARDDCYYTDTDSIVLQNELSPELVSPTEIGKFQKEHFVFKGIFLAPKSYSIQIESNEFILKHKGAAKDQITQQCFINLLEDPSLRLEFLCPLQ